MKIKNEINIKAIFGISLLLIFVILSAISLSVVRNKILTSVQLTGNEIASYLLLREKEKMKDYETFLIIAGKWINELKNKNQIPDDIKEVLVEYTEFMKNNLQSSDLELYSVVDGKIIAATYWEGDENYDFANAKWYNLAIQANGKPIYTDVYIDARTGKNVFTIAVEINSDKDVLAIDVYLDDEIIDVLSDELPKGSLYYLCDSNGNIVYRLSDKTQTEEAIQKHIDKLIKEIKKGRHQYSTSFTIDLKGKRRGVYYSISKDGWISIVTIPYEELLKEVEDLYYIYFGAFTIFLAVGLIVYMRERKFSKQMKQTNETVRVLGNSYYAIYKINLKNETYLMIKGSTDIHSKIEPFGEYLVLEREIISIIEEEAREEFKKAFSITNMRNLLKKRIENFGGDYKRLFVNGYRWVNVRVLFDESLEKNEVILCFKEIDEEKKRQLEYIEILKNSLTTEKKNIESKNMFFSSMSHDMRTPLNGIIGLSELGQNHINDPKMVSRYLSKINSSSKQLLALINDILELSKTEMDKKEKKREKFLLKESLNEWLVIFEVEAKNNNQRFHVNYEIKHNNVVGDNIKLRQILNNILSNAFKYTKENGSILFNVKEIEKETYSNFYFEIKDTGYGMSKEFLKNIFIPFEREQRFGAKDIKGTGLGMTIVKNLISQMDGEINIESELGVGTCVTIIIPLEILSEEPNEGAEVKEPEKIIEKKIEFKDKVVLLAEDNELNMEIATELLNMKGIKVIQAWNGVEAVEKFKNSSPFEIDMILMDMQMPEMDGCEATKEIRSLKREDAKEIPIIAVTANAFTEDIAATTLAGMNAHISKPIDFGVLEKTLESYVIKKIGRE